MSEEKVETKVVIEDNSVYKISYYYTDNHGIDHSIITIGGEDYIIRYRKRDLDKLKLHILQYIRTQLKKKDDRMPFKMWLKTFKGLYW